ncbi:hypothetical protein HAX54_012196, partial [Datura stramonium]|nr:hypothetical protein [Datura stramonium]
GHQFGNNFNHNARSQVWGGNQNGYRPQTNIQQSPPLQESSSLEEMKKQMMAQEQGIINEM